MGAHHHSPPIGSQLRGQLPVQIQQGPPHGVSVGGVASTAGGIGGDQAVADGLHLAQGPAGIEPEMGIGAPLHQRGGHALAAIDHPEGGIRRGTHQGRQLGLQAQAINHQHPSAAQAGQISRDDGQLVTAPGAGDQRLHLGAAGPHLARQQAYGRGGSQHGQELLPAAARRRALPFLLWHAARQKKRQQRGAKQQGRRRSLP